MGLAAASLGLEARVYLQQKKYERAIELYLEQLATGDPDSGASLIFTAAKALRTTRMSSGRWRSIRARSACSPPS